MNFSDLSDYLQKLENTASRLAITEILAEVYKKVTPQEAKYISYLLQGRVVPIFEHTEFGIAGKMMVRAIALATETADESVLKKFKQVGDFGTAVEELKTQNSKLNTQNQKLKITEVYETLLEVAQSQGSGSQEKKLQLLSELIKKSDPLSARYLVRIPLAKLRLGFSDMTILDALSWMLTGNKNERKPLEKAYNVRPDLGYIAETVKEKGIMGLSHVVPKVGTPILMARANRLTSAQDIILKLGTCAIEFKYDGLRLQVHYKKVQSSKFKVQSEKKDEIKMFSRSLENITEMFPDIARALLTQITAEEIIFEGEIVAYNPKTGVHVPFQETMQRKRKYDIAEKALEIPVKLYAFELLYADGKDFIHEAYSLRKKELQKRIKKGTTIVYAQEHIVSHENEVEKLFQESVKLHFEGIMAKKLEGAYEAGVRGWNWIKFKKAMDTKLADTVDVVVMGYTLGQGKRTSFGVGQFLAGVYDKKTDKYYSVTKVGTGLTDAQFKEFIERIKNLKVKEMPKEYVIDKLLEPDVWLKPSLVVELGSDEITRSPVHTAGRIMQASKSGSAQEVKTPGFALRFPRLVRFRDDKQATDATSIKEIQDLYTKQGAK